MLPRALLATFSLFLALSCKEEIPPAVATPNAAVPLPEKALGEFSGERAYAHVKTLTEMGPRPPESEGYRNALAYLENELKDLGWETKRQDLKATTPIGSVSFTNLLARYSPSQASDWDESPKYLIGGHLDTKRISEFVFLGANDSGSSTGVMLELARVLSNHPSTAEEVEFVFFDGEEAMLMDMTQRDGLYGSSHYATQLAYRKNKPSLAIILDIIGDPSHPLLIGGDSSSALKKHAIVAARALEISDWVTPYQYPIMDDHLPLMVRANLPVLHLIGKFMEMDYWHTAQDDMRNISAKALEDSGRLTLQILRQLGER